MATCRFTPIGGIKEDSNVALTQNNNGIRSIEHAPLITEDMLEDMIKENPRLRRPTNPSMAASTQTSSDNSTGFYILISLLVVLAMFL